MRLAALFSLVLIACTADVGVIQDPDLDDDADLAMIDGDTSEPEQTPADTETGEAMPPSASLVQCTKQRFLHIANYSFVAPLECVNGVCPNGCWGVQRRTSGLACDYAGGDADRVKTRDGGGPFASYNEIKPLHPDDDVAVASCKAAANGRKLRTYAVWNGSGWNNEGITATIRFAELYGPQGQSMPEFWTWYGSARSSWSPMNNISPETGIDFAGVKAEIARMCSATRTGWLGTYFFDGAASGGAGMAAWKREAIIRGMNYCTTH